MKTLVDSSILLDLFTNDPVWGDSSQKALEFAAENSMLIINPIIYAEVSVGFREIEELEEVLFRCQIIIEETPKEALFLAGKVFLNYKRRKGNKSNVLPDFFIGAHAAVNRRKLLTRDPKRIKNYFPTVEIVEPSRNARLFK